MAKKKTHTDIVSKMGYRDDSPFRGSESLNIHSPEGLIDMSNVGMPLMANGMLLEPYSGMHQVPTDKNGIVKESPVVLQDGGNMETAAIIEDPIKGEPAVVPDKLKNLSEGTVDFWNSLSQQFGMSLDDITSAYRGPDSGVGKNPGKSKHAHGEAIDINPEYTNVYNWLLNTKEGLQLLSDHNMGIIDETDPTIKEKTGATGDHFHIGTDSHYAQAAKDRLKNFDNLEETKSYKELHSGHLQTLQALPKEYKSTVLDMPREMQYDVLENLYKKESTNPEKVKYEIDMALKKKNAYVDKLSVDVAAPRQTPRFGQGQLFKAYGGTMGNPYQNGGQVLSGIGSGLYGLAEGALDTLSFGMTDNLTDKGYDAMFQNADTGAQGIRDVANIAGAATGAIMNPATAASAMGQGLEGIQGIAGRSLQDGGTIGTEKNLDFAGKPAVAPKPMSVADLNALGSRELAARSPEDIYRVQQAAHQQHSNRNFSSFDSEATPEELQSYIQSEQSLDPNAFIYTGLPTNIKLNRDAEGNPLYQSTNPTYTKPVRPTQEEIDTYNSRQVPTTPTPTIPPAPQMLDANTGQPLDTGIYSPEEGQIGDRQYSQYIEQFANSPEQRAKREQEAANLKARKAEIEGMSAEELRIEKGALTPQEKMAQDRQNFIKANTMQSGGNMFNNGGFGMNAMNEIPVTEFNAGGTHAENPLGGIPQGMGPNGQPNLVEQGELKIDDPRDPSGKAKFVVSAQDDMKITKELAETNGLPKKFVGKSVRKAADLLLRKDSRRDGDTIEENSKKQDLIGFINAHETLTKAKEAEKMSAFQEGMGALAREYPMEMQRAFGGNIHQYNPNMYVDNPDYYGDSKMDYMRQSLTVPPSPSSVPSPDLTGPTMGNPAVSGPVTEQEAIDAGYYTRQPEGSTTEKEYELEQYNPMSDVDNQEGQQSWGNFAMQMAPIALNLGKGLFGKEDSLNLGRLDKVSLDRVDADQQLRELGYDMSQAQRRNKGVSGGGYRANAQSLFNAAQKARAGIHSNVDRANTQIGNQEAGMNLKVGQINLGQEGQEQMYDKRAAAAKGNLVSTGVSQLAQLAKANQSNDLAADFNSMHSDRYSYDYLRPWEKKSSKKEKKD